MYGSMKCSTYLPPSPFGQNNHLFLLVHAERRLQLDTPPAQVGAQASKLAHGSSSSSFTLPPPLAKLMFEGVALVGQTVGIGGHLAGQGQRLLQKIYLHISESCKDNFAHRGKISKADQGLVFSCYDRHLKTCSVSAHIWRCLFDPKPCPFIRADIGIILLG